MNCNINLKIIPDSRGEKTLEAEIKTNSFSVKASVPSGKSRGSHEVFVIKSEEALKKFEEIKPEIIERLASKEIAQKQFDEFLIELDGTKNKNNLGGNLILVLSLAFARLKAESENKELFEYVSRLSGPAKSKTKKQKNENFPRPIFNVINGGAHSSVPSSLEFQEFQIIPKGSDFEISFSLGLEFYRKLGEALAKKFGKENIKFGDEAGYCADFHGNEEALEILADLIETKKYPLNIGLDAAASQFFRPADAHEKNVGEDAQNGFYIIKNKKYSAEELKEYYIRLIHSFNIISIEDPFSEEDFGSFSSFAAELEKINSGSLDFPVIASPRSGLINPAHSLVPLIITDDLTATNLNRLKIAVEKNSGNAILIKPNQIGTLTETLETAKFARENNWQTVASHRSGETSDDFIADLAIGIGAWGIKAGAPAKPERLAKYARLLKIYQQL